MLTPIRRAVVPALLVVVFSVLATTAEACPTCKEALANSGDGANFARGYFWSILFMMSMPFLILGGLGGYFYLEVRRARAGMSQSDATGVPEFAVTNS